MRRLCWFALMMFVIVGESTRAWDIGWVTQFGNGVSTGTGGGGGKTDGTGLYVSGAVSGALPGQTGAGSLDVYVRKFSVDGTELWTRQFGSTGVDLEAGLVTDHTGVYLAGRTTGALPGQTSAGGSDAFVRKYDSNGNVAWTVQFGTPRFDSPWFGGIAIRNDAVFVAGSTAGTFPGQPAGAGEDFFVARVAAATGAVDWIRQFGVRGGPLDVGGIAVDETGIYAAATLIPPGAGLADPQAILFRKFDGDGNVMWARETPVTVGCGMAVWGLSAYDQHVYQVAQATREFVEGHSDCKPAGHEIVGFVQKYDGDGQLMWSRSIKGDSPEAGSGFTGAKTIWATDSGIYVAANLTNSFPGHSRDVPRSDRSICPGLIPGNDFFDKLDGYVRRYNFDGDVIWTHQFGSDVFDLVTGIGTDATSVYVVGDTSCSIQEDVPWSGASRDVFVQQMAIEPTTLAGKVQLIVGQVTTLSDRGRLGAGELTSLAGHLADASSTLQNDDADRARHALTVFITYVDVLVGRNDLSAAEGTALIDAATRILSQL
jgi:hypothetical protein